MAPNPLALGHLSGDLGEKIEAMALKVDCKDLLDNLEMGWVNQLVPKNNSKVGRKLAELAKPLWQILQRMVMELFNGVEAARGKRVVGLQRWRRGV